jgi:hypothetical protein
MRVEILAAACPDWLGPALIMNAECGTVAFANMPCLSESYNGEIRISAEGELRFGDKKADEKFRTALQSFRESADVNCLLFLSGDAKPKTLAVIFQRPTGFLKDLLIEAGDGSAELILVKFELRPDQLAHEQFFLPTVFASA